MTKSKAIKLISDEYDRAMLNSGHFNGPHEGYAVMLEEIDELWTNIKLDRPESKLAAEAKQVGAMALKFLVGCCK